MRRGSGRGRAGVVVLVEGGCFEERQRMCGHGPEKRGGVFGIRVPCPSVTTNIAVREAPSLKAKGFGRVLLTCI